MRGFVAWGVLAVLAGCSPAPNSAGPLAGAGPNRPYPADGFDASTPAVQESKLQLAQLQKAYKGAKSAYSRKPGADAKAKYLVATVRLGTASMTSPALDRKVKYRNALRLYREALKLDPTNREALANKNLIESIYRQLGRPVPQ